MQIHRMGFEDQEGYEVQVATLSSVDSRPPWGYECASHFADARPYPNQHYDPENHTRFHLPSYMSVSTLVPVEVEIGKVSDHLNILPLFHVHPIVDDLIFQPHKVPTEHRIQQWRYLGSGRLVDDGSIERQIFQK